MSNDFLARYFGPLSKSSCVYFFFFSFIGFISMILCMIGLLVHFFKNMRDKSASKKEKNDNSVYVTITFMNMFISSFLLYFSNRLFNTMCVKVL